MVDRKWLFGYVSVGWLSETGFLKYGKKGWWCSFFFEKTGVEFIFQCLKSYLEYLATAVCSNLTRSNICVVYRPHDHTTLLKFLESLDTLMNELRFLKGTPIILGDFNIEIFLSDKKPEISSYKLLPKSFNLDVFFEWTNQSH